jgi:hypothetical protein
MNQTLILIFAVFSTCVYLPGLYAQPIHPVRTMDVPNITETPVIDGLSNESHWSPAQELDIFNPTGWTGPSDLTARFNAAWSYGHFYIFVIVTDDIEHNWNGTDGGAWEFDNIEIFFQLDTNTIETDYSDNTVQLRFSRGESGFSSEHGRAGESEFIWCSVNTDDGWLLEAAIPWTSALPLGSLPEDIMDYLPLIGFDLAVADSDNSDGNVLSGNRDVQAAWDMDDPASPNDRTEDNAWNNAGAFGYITLVGDAVEMSRIDVTHLKSACGTDAVEPTETISLQAFPNPATETLQLINCRIGFPLVIVNIAGNIVFSGIADSEEPVLNISLLQDGLYLIKAGNTEIVKFLKH